ncbi:peptide deformylase, mitochondrial-like [Leptopilina heterotoma]|uniref:peptide deformylase, mitochondrial-like n=1 Tax=Leptopilina heterotoma TaxID=63436 RepID=UPI001CA92116|nr:peptide deformylase, mitochondrial-like [Leptopilina heterotoma]XP_043466095.1 peptide deformylase, mitochondrial-like [Leptopilina heterotoma]
MNRPLRAFKHMMRNYLKPNEVSPPYFHVCQIGDPVLRQPTERVAPETIPSKEIQYIIKVLVKTMRLYDACGLSAPQIGVPLQIFAAEITERQSRIAGPTRRKTHKIEAFPLKIFINPEIKVIDHSKIMCPEGCVSTALFVADVPRFKEVLITGLDPSGETVSWQAKDWTARIIQHEVDHLKGHLYTDKMDPTTLTMEAWQQVNNTRGRLKISLLP